MSEVIIVIRVWALWQFSRIVGASLLIVAILGISITSISYVKFSDEMTFVDMNNIAPNLDGCFSAPRSNIVFLAFVGLVVWETLVVILLLSRGARHFGHVSNGFLLRMYQNGIMYYIFMAFVSCINIDILLTGRPESANLLTPIQRVLHSVMASHMLFQLRESARKRQHFPDDRSPVDIDPGTLVFASRLGNDAETWVGDGRGLGS
ncbi:hypothetical protein PC9H_005567 [Pleurotus ostreatus]|uniref:Uncharacterized protein n=1 Tax=Pleurotus ostreatus TaxID=5322 RepID=A0A8H6ZZS5_PLEOS|nr:uncharacterized protein PC9H_005567 [Pleurotus ostreatus]KAF7433606.1 hypothetical protein PC9H_005567 [Pleurotus ostreatus]